MQHHVMSKIYQVRLMFRLPGGRASKGSAALETDPRIAGRHVPTGGCGSMYKVNIQSPKFAGISLVKQHRMVTEVLRSEIVEMHGLTINTSVPSK